MRFTALFGGLLAIVSSAVAQLSDPSITSPALTACQPASFTISGSAPPFIIAILPGGMVNAPAIAFLPDVTAAGAFTWNVNLSPGSNITLRVTDSRGMIGYSAPLVIQAGQTTACVSASASVSQFGAATTAAGSGSASSGPTYTVPLDIVPQFAARGVIVPMATQAASGSGSASGSGAATTFTVATSASDATLSATLIVKPTAFTGIAFQGASAASQTVQATEICSWGSTITTTVIRPTDDIESGIASIRVGFSNTGSATSSASAASAGPTTLTGYSATCSDVGAAVIGSASQGLTSSYANFAVLATFNSGYFTWLSSAPVTAGVTASGSGSASASSATSSA